jgi:lycopene cyclase domain-containing protein
MTYGQFPLFLLAPCLAVLAGLLARRYRRTDDPAVRDDIRRGMRWLTALVGAAVVFTTPWDSWLIGRAVWWYPPGSVLGTLFRVPYEELLVTAGTTVLTAFWTLLVVAGRPMALCGTIGAAICSPAVGGWSSPSSARWRSGRRRTCWTRCGSAVD